MAMQIFLIIYAFVYAIYFAVMMGLFLRYRDEMDKAHYEEAHKWGKAWHGWGAIMRVGMILLLAPVSFPDWKYMILLSLWSILASYVAFNIIINLFRNYSIWYCGSPDSGTDSWWDRLTWKYHKWIQIGLIVISAVYTVLYYVL